MWTWALCMSMESQTHRVCDPYPTEKACEIAWTNWEHRALDFFLRNRIDILSTCTYTWVSDEDLLVKPIRQASR